MRISSEKMGSGMAEDDRVHVSEFLPCWPLDAPTRAARLLPEERRIAKRGRASVRPVKRRVVWRTIHRTRHGPRVNWVRTALLKAIFAMRLRTGFLDSRPQTSSPPDLRSAIISLMQCSPPSQEPAPPSSPSFFDPRLGRTQISFNILSECTALPSGIRQVHNSSGYSG